MFRKALLLTALTVFAAGGLGDLQAGDDKLPDYPGVACDARILQADGKFKISKTGSLIPKNDPRRVVIFWVLEAQADLGEDFGEVRAAWGVRPSDSHFRGPRILFKDGDKVLIEETVMNLQGFHPGVKKGDGVRIFFEVPRELMQETRFTAIVQ